MAFYLIIMTYDKKNNYDIKTVKSDKISSNYEIKS